MVEYRGLSPNGQCWKARCSSAHVPPPTHRSGQGRIPSPGLPATTSSERGASGCCKPVLHERRRKTAVRLVASASLACQQRRNMIDLHLRSLLHITGRLMLVFSVVMLGDQRTWFGGDMAKLPVLRGALLCRAYALVEFIVERGPLKTCLCAVGSTPDGQVEDLGEWPLRDTFSDSLIIALQDLKSRGVERIQRAYTHGFKVDESCLRKVYPRAQLLDLRYAYPRGDKRERVRCDLSIGRCAFRQPIHRSWRSSVERRSRLYRMRTGTDSSLLSDATRKAPKS
jgi:hypothetical protein